MKLFQFATTKPPAHTIWETLEKTDISAEEGFTDLQIKFMMFIILQLRSDFKAAKQSINNYTTVSQLQIAVTDIMSIATTPISHIIAPPEHFPLWVHPNLYTPYYMLKQLAIPSISPLWLTLFDREELKINEQNNLSVDMLVEALPTTLYKLWNTTLKPVMSHYSTIFCIDATLPVHYVSNKEDIVFFLNNVVKQYLSSNIGEVFDGTTKINISEFKLGASDAS